MNKIASNNIIPELVILNFLQAGLDAVLDDFEEENKFGIVYNYFEDMQMGKTKYFEEAKKIFGDRDKRVLPFIGLNLRRIELPTIHILLPSESKGEENYLGANAGNGHEIGFSDAIKTERKSFLTESYMATYNLMITGKNQNEVVIIYHFVRAMILSMRHNMSMQGINNLQISGQELQLNTDIVPPTTFFRTINLNFYYQINTKTFSTEKFFNRFFVCLKNITDENN